MQYIKNMNTMLTNRVKWHSRWSLIMCVTLMAFMIFGVFLSTGCSSKDTTNGDQTPNPDSPDLACPTGTARLAGASKKTTDTCMLDTDGDGTPDSTDSDDDDDGTPDLTDIDDDGDGLIEIDTLEKLHNIRYNSAGTSYKIVTDGTNDAGDTTGCGGIGGVAACNGYELTQDLSFDKDGDGETWSGDSTSGYTLDGGDNASPHFVVTKVVGSTNYSGGWEPIASFNAIFEGNGHTITGLAIHRNEQSIGMFGIIEAGADIRNVGLVASLVYCIKTSDGNRVGGLVGLQTGGSITDSYVIGNAGGDIGNDFIGGLVGSQTGGSITDSYAKGDAKGGLGGDSTGGLVGRQEDGSITGSYATGAAEGGKGGAIVDRVGGLVGLQTGGSIAGSYATGNARGDLGNDYIGGLVGSQEGGSIAGSYATGDVDGGAGSDSTGGLVGRQEDGSITGSYSTGAVNGGAGTGANFIGGLVGSQNSGSIAGSYATGDVDGGAGGDFAGGLVGLQTSGSIAGSYATGDVDGGAGSGDSIGGLVGNFIGGSIAGSYATGDVDGGAGSGDKAGALVGEKGSSSLAKSYGFGTAMGETPNTYGPPPTDASNNAISAEQLTLSNAGMLWDDMNKNTLGAWDFGTNSQIPALRYADYDGGDGTSNDHTIYYCDSVEAGMIPTPLGVSTTTPPTPPPPTIPVPNCGDFIPGQGRE